MTTFFITEFICQKKKHTFLSEQASFPSSLTSFLIFISIFTLSCKCSWFNIRILLLCSFTSFYEITLFNVISSSISHSVFFMYLYAYLSLRHIFLENSLPLWITYDKNIIPIQFHFIAKEQKDKVIKGTTLEVYSLCSYVKKQILLCTTWV